VRLKVSTNGPVEDLFDKLDDTGVNLIVIGQPAASAGGPDGEDGLRIHTVAADPANDAELARAGIPQPSFYLVRPDGHVGLCGVRVDSAAIRRYLSERLRVGSR
jgi:hypothetical protein